MTTPLDLDAVEAIPRFNPSLNCRTCEGDMQPSSRGDWYNVDDVQTAIDALTAELRAARERIAGLEADAARWRAVAPRMTAIDFNYACGDDQTEQVAIVFLPKGERWKLDAGLIADKLIAIDAARTATPHTESEDSTR